MVGAIVGVVGNLLGTFVKSRATVSEAKAEAQVARLKNGIPGYSDEVLVFIWSAPFVMSFIPSMQPYATEGFQILETLPEWYMGGFLSITLAVFGIDKLLMFKKP